MNEYLQTEIDRLDQQIKDSLISKQNIEHRKKLTILLIEEWLYL